MEKIEFLNLGKHPITNSYLNSKYPKNEFLYNLRLIYHSKTKLISLAKFVSPKIIRRNLFHRRIVRRKNYLRKFFR